MKENILMDSFDALPLGFLQLDGKNRIMKWNRWMEINTGFSRHDVLDSSIEALYPGHKSIPEIIGKVRRSEGQPLILSQLLHSYFLPVRLEETNGPGATFSFTLPMKWQGEKGLNPKVNFQQTDDSKSANSLDILLVEDHPLNRKLTAAQLKKLGHRSSYVVDGSECLDILKREKFDMVLMDLQMPVMDGYEAAQRIRKGEAGKGNKYLPIIAVSANASATARERCFDVGMNDYFSKPVKLSILKTALDYWCSSINREKRIEVA